jgi:hypothetical protein
MQIEGDVIVFHFHLDQLIYAGDAKSAGLKDGKAYFPYWPDFDKVQDSKNVLIDRDFQVANVEAKIRFLIHRETEPISLDLSPHFARRLAQYLQQESEKRKADDGHGFVDALYPDVTKWDLFPTPLPLERSSNRKPVNNENEERAKVNFRWFLESFKGPRHVYFEPVEALCSHSVLQISPSLYLHKGKGFTMPILSTLDELVASYRPKYIHVNSQIDSQP